MINVSKPSLGVAEQQAAVAALASGWIGQGQKVAAFEARCAEVLQAKHFIALSSCTKALEVALLITGCEAGDEIIVPSLTYASVIQAIIKHGLVPVFTDINANDLNISIDEIESNISRRTKAILPLHFRGHSCDTEKIKEIAARYGLSVIEDAAHAFGSIHKGKPVGAESELACFSFGPIKNICAIEGGGIATNNDELARKILSYRNLGMGRSTWQRYHHTGDERPWYYEVVAAGDKCQMNDVGAAIGLVQLNRIEEIKAKKYAVVEEYLSALKGMKGISIPETNNKDDFYYIFSVLMDAPYREKFMRYLWDKGITTAVHYYPNHLQPLFEHYSKYRLPVTEDTGKRIVTLPSYTDLSTTDQEYVITTIRDFTSKL